uniref:Uncharacterized protein n=1 Tax=Schistocephalus solidus TaxID=70667 RepID=A0A0X3NJL3_SCHSO
MEDYRRVILILLMIGVSSKVLCSQYRKDLDTKETSLSFQASVEFKYRDPKVKSLLRQIGSTFGGLLLVKKLVLEMNKIPGPPTLPGRLLPALIGLLNAKYGPKIVKVLIKTTTEAFLFDPHDGRETLLEQLRLRNQESDETTTGSIISPETAESILKVLFDAEASQTSLAVKIMQYFSNKGNLLQLIKLTLFGSHVDQLFNLPAESGNQVTILSTLPRNRKKMLFMAGGDVLAKVIGGLREGQIIDGVAENIREAIKQCVILKGLCGKSSSNFKLPELLAPNKEYLNLGMVHATESIKTSEMAVTLKRLVTNSLEHPTVKQVYSKIQNMMNESVEISPLPTDKRTVLRESVKLAKDSLANSRQKSLIKQILPKMAEYLVQSWKEEGLGRLLGSTVLDVLTSPYLNNLVMLATKINIGDPSNLSSKLSQFFGSGSSQTSFFATIQRKLGKDSAASITENFLNYLAATDDNSDSETSSGVVNLSDILGSLEQRIVMVT